MNKIFKIVLIVLSTVIIFLLLLFFINQNKFENKIESEVSTILDLSPTGSPGIITEDDINQLPYPVQKYLQFAGVIGTAKVNNVYLEQHGRIKTEPSASSMEFSAQQFFSGVQPAFLWKCQIPAFPMLSIYARDKLINGQGNMWIRMAHLFTIADASGTQIDESSLTRYMSEIIWFPGAFVNDFLQWQVIDSLSAQATISLEDISASGIFYFDSTGKITEFKTLRYREGHGMQTWKTPVEAYKEMNGIMIPYRAQAVWELPEGDFTYIDIEITDIKYNIKADGL